MSAEYAHLVQKDSILIVAEQPWQIELAAIFANKLRALRPDLRVEIAVTDYFTFLHDARKLESISTNFAVRIHSLQNLYHSWQTNREPDIVPIQHSLSEWVSRRKPSRSLEVLEKTNQLIYGWERNYFYLPISDKWKKKILLDSIHWCEDILVNLKPKMVVSIERNTLCNSLFFEIAKSEGIEHVTYIVSRFGNRWIPHLNFGLGQDHPLSTESKLSNHLELKVRDFQTSIPSNLMASNQSYLYRAAAGNLQNVFSQKLIHRLPYIMGRDLGNGVSNLARLTKQIVLRLRYRKTRYAFPVVRLEQNLFKLSIWEMKQVIYYHIRMLGIRKWGIHKPPSSPYFFWGLHSRPEDSTSVLGFGQDEHELIKLTAALIPDGTSLLVKEHPIMFGVRARNFYAGLRKIKKLVLVDAFSNTQSFVTHDSCLGVIGVSGTMLLECELANKGAFAFGVPEFKNYLSSDGASLTSFLNSQLNSNADILKSRAVKYADRVLALSTEYDVPYLHDLRDPSVEKMLGVWADTLIKGGLSG
jgi:hypothetical protein